MFYRHNSPKMMSLQTLLARTQKGTFSKMSKLLFSIHWKWMATVVVSSPHPLSLYGQEAGFIFSEISQHIACSIEERTVWNDMRVRKFNFLVNYPYNVSKPLDNILMFNLQRQHFWNTSHPNNANSCNIPNSEISENNELRLLNYVNCSVNNNYPSTPARAFSVRVPWVSADETSSSSEDPALEDSSSLSASTESLDLLLHNTSRQDLIITR